MWLTLIWKNRWLLLAGVFLLSLLWSHWYVYSLGQAREQDRMQAEILKAVKEAKERNDKIDRKVMRYSDPELDAELDKWMRD